MKVVLTLGCVLAALCFAGQARASGCVPSGNSAVGEYFDPLPGPGCNQAPPTATTAPGRGASTQASAPGSSRAAAPGSAQTTLPPVALRAFAAHGSAGQAVVQLIASTAPPGAGTADSAGVSGAPARHRGALLRVTQGRGPLAAAVAATTTAVTGGAGLALVIFAAITLAAAIGWRAWQRRRSGD